ncbi:MAG: DUF3108 domain-containing protein [Rhizobiaceae bacterium]|nr:DUF3108 domain-containing protein [Rhizobiaceae bacterium]
MRLLSLKFRKLFCLASVGFLAVGSAVFPALTAPKTVQTTKFNVNYGGLRIGNLTFTIELAEGGYALSARGKTAGVARLFSKGKGSFSSEGRFEGANVIAAEHKIQVTEKGKTAKLSMSFDNGNLKSVTANPKKKVRTGKEYVPITDELLKSIIDPASSIVVPTTTEASSGRDVCGRTLNVYDGETRFDIVLSYKSTRPISATGFKGLAYVCKFMYVPVAGHKKGHKSVEIMRKNEKMEIWLAPITGTSIYTPIKIDVGSPVGRFVAYPKNFSSVVVDY